jgi:hypothetical protein
MKAYFVAVYREPVPFEGFAVFMAKTASGHLFQTKGR